VGTNCRAWLFRIFFYVRSEYRRTQARQPLVFSLDRCKESTFSSETHTPSDVTLEGIRLAFAQVPDPFQTVLLLADIEGLRYREIADMLEIPIGTVMSRLSRGRQILRARLSSASLKPGENSSVEKGKKSGRC
jgi:RNA polymerase sigma-70 factor (ECF subfamily)